MEKTTLKEDILVYCVTADSFPNGVKKAHDTLHALMSPEAHPHYFGLSWPDNNGSLIYKAAAEALHENELSGHSLETMVIVKGDYLYADLEDFMKDTSVFGKTFQQLIHDDRIAPDAFCIEWYLNENLCRCMVRMK